MTCSFRTELPAEQSYVLSRPSEPSPLPASSLTTGHSPGLAIEPDHVLGGVVAAVVMAHAGLAHHERLEAFAAQFLQHGLGGDVGVPLEAAFVRGVSKDGWGHAPDLLIRQGVVGTQCGGSEACRPEAGSRAGGVSRAERGDDGSPAGARHRRRLEALRARQRDRPCCLAGDAHLIPWQTTESESTDHRAREGLE
jgi:hypothetical protein